MATRQEAAGRTRIDPQAEIRPVFLTAEWRNLLMLNYEVDPALLSNFIPAGTELDRFEGRTFVSLVGFQFLETRVLGWSVPFHRQFEEVNLRFYVHRRVGDEVRRGVVFVKEIVPRWAVTMVARLVYYENYATMPMGHDICTGDGGNRKAIYRWRSGQRWNEMRATTQGELLMPEPDSEEAFITGQYWGYTKLLHGRTAEYRVEHSPWRLWRVIQASLDCDVAHVYAPAWANCLTSAPHSAFLVEGSAVRVRRGTIL
jgi:uncharacterized protein YqjF (DUF2071 family)